MMEKLYRVFHPGEDLDSNPPSSPFLDEFELVLQADGTLKLHLGTANVSTVLNHTH